MKLNSRKNGVAVFVVVAFASLLGSACFDHTTKPETPTEDPVPPPRPDPDPQPPQPPQDPQVSTRTVFGRNSAWTTGPYITAGTAVEVNVGGEVCLAKPRFPWNSHKCGTADREGPGGLLIQLPDGTIMKYHDARAFVCSGMGRIKFKVDDTKYTDNEGSYEVKVTY